jgi:uncharacterized protein (TIGR02117 family)
MKFLFVVAFLQLQTACSTSIMQLNSLPPGENDKRIFVVHNYWHAALVVRKADLSQGLVPEQEHFPEAEYLEISWGDRDYFPAIEESVGLALRAAFWSRGSVLHVVGFRGAVKDYFTEGEIIELALSPESVRRLSEFVSASLLRADPFMPAQSQPGLVANGRFYRATGKFSIFRTCNTWIAEALKSAGSVSVPGTLSPPGAWLGKSAPMRCKNEVLFGTAMGYLGLADRLKRANQSCPLQLHAPGLEYLAMVVRC